MAQNAIVINVDLRETRVALIEKGVIAELQIERATHRGTVGDVVLGRVTRVLPGMQAAFIDVGQERAAFLHVEDLIRPDDFEAYLYRKDTSDEGSSSRGEYGKGVAAYAAEDDDGPEVAGTAVAGAGGATDVAKTDAADSDQDEADDEDDDVADDDDVAPDEDDVADDDDEADEDDDVADDDDDADDVVDDEADDDDADSEESVDLADVDENDDDDEADDDEPDDDDESVDLASDEVDADEIDDAELIDDADLSDDNDAAAAGASGASDADSADEADREPLAADVETSDAASDDAETSRRQQPGARRTARRRRGRKASARGSDDAAGEDPAPVAKTRAGSGEETAQQRPVGKDAADKDGADKAAPEKEAAADGRGARQSSSSRRSRGNRRRRGKRGAEEPAVNPRQARGKSSRQGKSERGRGNRRNGAKLNRSESITEVVREGDQVIVQITKEPIGTKGARVSSHVSLPGRFVVYLPTVEHVGISSRIGSASERGRLRKAIESVKPKQGGLIVRTLGEGLTKKQLKADVGYLIRCWEEVSRKKQTAKAPETLYTELDLVLKVARDLFTDSIDTIVIDDRDQYIRLVRFIEMFLPHRVKDIQLYSGDEPIFDAYGIEDEIGRSLSRKVPLPSGGSLVVDQAEALTAIDVNTGRYVGKGSRDLEETALRTNLEAVEEIAYQLRFRNIGGLVILDLIDMERGSNRERVWRALEHALAKDKAKTTINRISELGLIEMTRKRTRESLGRVLHEPCFYCDGTGHIQSRATIAYEILRQIRRERQTLPGYSVLVNAHPAVVDFLKGEERDALQDAERRYSRRIKLVGCEDYHIEQYDLHGE